MSEKRKIYRDHFLLGDGIEEKLSMSSEKQIPGFRGILYENLGKDDYGNRILKKINDNTVTVGGAIQALEHLTGVEAKWKPKTLNEIHGVNTNLTGNNLTTRICLYGVGVGGSGLEFGSVVKKNEKLREVPGIIPLRTGSALTGDDANLYKFKIGKDDGTFDYYLKEFADPPIIKTCWKDSLDDEVDGTEVLDEIHDSTRTENLQTFAEYILDFNTKDVREYYESIGALEQARYNSIGLYLADKVSQSDGSYEYANIRLFSYLNIDNKSVRIKTACQYVYRILSLV